VPAALAVALIGAWLAVQATAGRLPARLLSYRTGDGLPTVGPSGYGGFAAAAATGVAAATGGSVGAGTLTAVQVARLALAAGLSPAAAVTAVAIARRESGFVTTAHGGPPAEPNDDSYGLWQINMLGSLGPARRRQFGLASDAELFNPEVNARAMYAISSGGTNWSPWTTYAKVTSQDRADAMVAVDQARGR